MQEAEHGRSPQQRLWLAAEYLALFFVVPTICVAGLWPWHPLLIMVPLGIVAVGWHLRTPHNLAQLLLLTHNH
jgi:hypothetical protein